MFFFHISRQPIVFFMSLWSSGLTFSIWSSKTITSKLPPQSQRWLLHEFTNSRKKQKEGEWHVFHFEDILGRWAHCLSSLPIGWPLITWLHQTSKDAGKCSLKGTWTRTQLPSPITGFLSPTWTSTLQLNLGTMSHWPECLFFWVFPPKVNWAVKGSHSLWERHGALWNAAAVDRLPPSMWSFPFTWSDYKTHRSVSSLRAHFLSWMEQWQYGRVTRIPSNAIFPFLLVFPFKTCLQSSPNQLIFSRTCEPHGTMEDAKIF